jgi:hypothetical protein
VKSSVEFLEGQIRGEEPDVIGEPRADTVTRAIREVVVTSPSATDDRRRIRHISARSNAEIFGRMGLSEQDIETLPGPARRAARPSASYRLGKHPQIDAQFLTVGASQKLLNDGVGPLPYRYSRDEKRPSGRGQFQPPRAFVGIDTHFYQAAPLERFQISRQGRAVHGQQRGVRPLGGSFLTRRRRDRDSNPWSRFS